MINLSIFKGKEAHHTKLAYLVDATWDELSLIVTESMWAPSIFEDNIRSNKNFLSTDLLVLDIDEGSSIGESSNVFQEYTHIIGTTKSHMAEKNGVVCERFRLILQLDSRITNREDYAATWFAAHAMLPVIDAACKDPARFYFPCTNIIVRHKGESFKVVRAGGVTKPVQSQAVTKPAPGGQKGQISKRALNFLLAGKDQPNWHIERNNFVRECKQNLYTFEEMYNLFCTQYVPDATDEYQFNHVWNTEVKHAPRLPVSNDLKNVILGSKLIINMADPTHTILVDLNNGKEHDVHIDTIKTSLDKKEYQDFVSSSRIVARLEYGPKTYKPLYRDGDNLDVYNLYNPPSWLRKMFYNAEPIEPLSELPQLYRDFFMHLTDEHLPSFHYVIDWLATSLQGRNLTFLTAIGEQGIGKGILGTIMQKLHGDRNFAKVRDSVFKERFNSPLKNRTLIYVDELDLKTKESLDRIKDVVNYEIEIEEKGLDARSFKNYASFYLSSNTMDAVVIEGGDRRFSIIQLTDKKFTEHPLYARVDSLTDDESISELARYLRFKTVTTNMNRPFQDSRRFEQVRTESLKDWQSYLVEDWIPMHRGEEQPLSELGNALVGARLLSDAPGHRKVSAVQKRFPELFTLYRKGGAKVWTIVVK